AAAEPDEADAASRAERLAAIAATAAIDEPPSAAQGAIAERLAWTCPHRAATTIAAKTSVTEMKRVLADGAAHAAEAESLEDAAARVALGEPGSAHGEAADGQAVRSRATGAPAGLAPLSPHSFRLRRP